MLRKSLVSLLVVSGLALAACDRKDDAPTPTTYDVSLFVPGSEFHGLHGLAFGPDDMLYAGSVVGMSIYKVDPVTGDVSVEVGPPNGQADDLEFSEAGGLAWTGFLLGKAFYRTPQGEVRTLAEDLPGVNSLAFNKEGRLFASQVFLGDALYELHLSGKFPPRKVMEGMGGLNGFDFGPDGALYGPLWFKGEIARIDVDSGTLQVVSSGYQVPAAVNFDSKGNLYVIDNETGEIFRVNLENKERTLVATAPSNLDNLAFDKDDNLYVSNMSDAAIYEVDTETGDLRTVTSGPLTVPAGLAIANGTLYVADTFTLSKVDLATGEVGDVSRLISDHEYPTGVTVKDGILLVASANSGFVQTFDTASQKRLSRWTGFLLPVVAHDLGDQVAVLEGAGRLTLVSGEDGATRITLVEGLVDPAGMAVGDDAFYVTEAAAGLLSSIDRTTGDKTVIADGLMEPEGVLRTADGTLYVVEVGLGAVREIKPDGASRLIAEGLDMGLKGSAPFPPAYIPSGIAMDEAGAIYVSSDTLNAIYKIAPHVEAEGEE